MERLEASLCQRGLVECFRIVGGKVTYVLQKHRFENSMNRDFSYFRRSSELSGLLLRAVDRGERVDECNLLGYT